MSPRFVMTAGGGGRCARWPARSPKSCVTARWSTRDACSYPSPWPPRKRSASSPRPSSTWAPSAAWRSCCAANRRPPPGWCGFAASMASRCASRSSGTPTSAGPSRRSRLRRARGRCRLTRGPASSSMRSSPAMTSRSPAPPPRCSRSCAPNMTEPRPPSVIRAPRPASPSRPRRRCWGASWLPFNGPRFGTRSTPAVSS